MRPVRQAIHLIKCGDLLFAASGETFDESGQSTCQPHAVGGMLRVGEHPRWLRCAAPCHSPAPWMEPGPIGGPARRGPESRRVSMGNTQMLSVASVPDVFMAAPFWGLQPRVFPPAVYHDQSGAAALTFNSEWNIPASNARDGVAKTREWVADDAGTDATRGI